MAAFPNIDEIFRKAVISKKNCSSPISIYAFDRPVQIHLDANFRISVDWSFLNCAKKEEKRPLHRSDVPRSSQCAPYGKGFNIIIICFILFAFCVTTALIVDIFYYKHVDDVPTIALVTVNDQCGNIGMNILKEGGSAVDAVVAVQFCLGVTSPHLTGIGGGGIININKRDSDLNVIINFKEKLPVNASLGISGGLEMNNNVLKIGVPGVLRGLSEAHSKFGKLPWRRLVEPSISLAENGFLMTASLYDSIIQESSLIHPHLQNIFKPNGTPISIGEIVMWKSLSRTLREIAREGPNEFYNGSLTNSLVKEAGGVLSQDDLSNYHVKIESPLEIYFKNWHLYVPNMATGGTAFTLTLKLMESLQNAQQDLAANHQYQTLIQSIKSASFAVLNMTDYEGTNGEMKKPAEDIFSATYINKIIQNIKNNDTSYLNEIPDVQPPTTASIIAYDANNMLAVAVSGLGSPFGSQIVTSSGIILNDAFLDMDRRYITLQLAADMVTTPVTPILPLIFNEIDKECDTAFAAASADFQMIAQILLHLNSSLPAVKAANHPKFKVFLQSQEGDIGLNEENSTVNEIEEELRVSGQTIFHSNKVISSISMLIKNRYSMEAFTDEQDGFYNVT